jgi:hypothetical protein
MVAFMIGKRTKSYHGELKRKEKEEEQKDEIQHSPSSHHGSTKQCHHFGT